jgi:membrane glycosyltransferase
LTHTILALAVIVLVAWRLPAMLPWLSLVLMGPLLSVPFSRLMASNKLGLASRRHGWFLIPEETQPPGELRELEEPFESSGGYVIPALDNEEDAGLVQAALDPRINSIHVSLLHERQRVPIRTHEHMTALCDQLLRNGPTALSAQEKRLLLWDADSMLTLHRKLWDSPTDCWHSWWQEAFHNYLSALPQNEMICEEEASVPTK